jgi:hypothetical protein
MINNFTYFLYNNDISDYLNCYSTFIMTRKDLRNNILNHRMNLLINCYSNHEKQKKYKLIENYIHSYKDDYLSRSFNLNEEEKEKEKPENPEQRDEDVEDHYKYMFINPKPKPEIDYDEIDRNYELKLLKEEEEKQREKEIILENDYNDDYDDYEYYNSDEYDDYENDYDIMDDYY